MIVQHFNNARHTVISFPATTAHLGGASALRMSSRFVWVTVGDKTIRMPRSQFPRTEEYDGFAAAERARTWAYRNA